MYMLEGNSSAATALGSVPSAAIALGSLALASFSGAPVRIDID
jgi:hypothetical protein